MRAWLLWWAARRRVKRDAPTVIAVGGAIAKTSTKTAIGAVLTKAFTGQVRVGYGNLNTYLGVPLAILGFEVDFYKQKIGWWGWLKLLVAAKYRSFFTKLPPYLVLEYGTDHPHDIDRITAQLPPNISVITIVGPAHLANYPSVAEMVKDEGYLAERTRPDGIVFINHDDPYREDHRGRTQARVRELVMPLELMATEYAKAVAQELKVAPEKIAEGLKSFQRPEHRFNQKDVGPYHLFDDSYNASPLAMQAALNQLQKMPGRHVAILGSMLELGDKEVEYHQEVGRYAQAHADYVIGVGELAKHYQPKIWYPTSDKAAEEIFSFLKEGDSILVKGSKSVHMDKIVEVLERTDGRH